MQRINVQQRLFDLFESQYMSATVKLQIVRALDQSTRRACGMRWFVGIHPEQLHKTSETTTTESAYQRLVRILTTKQVRSASFMSCIVSRLSVHNVLSDVARRVCTVSPRQESARLRPHSPVLLLRAFVSSATTSHLSCVAFGTNQVFAFQCSVLLIFCRLQVRKSRPTRR